MTSTPNWRMSPEQTWEGTNCKYLAFLQIASLMMDDGLCRQKWPLWADFLRCPYSASGYSQKFHYWTLCPANKFIINYRLVKDYISRLWIMYQCNLIDEIKISNHLQAGTIFVRVHNTIIIHRIMTPWKCCVASLEIGKQTKKLYKPELGFSLNKHQLWRNLKVEFAVLVPKESMVSRKHLRKSNK